MSRLVECADCGYRWESSADSPRCSQNDCGRSRNVEPVEDGDHDEPEPDHDEPEPDHDDDDHDDDDHDEPEPDHDEDNSGYTPAFETKTVRTDTDRTGQVEANAEGDEPDHDEPEPDHDEPAAVNDGDDLPDIDPETLEPAMKATFGLMAAKRGDYWQLSDDEAEQLAEGWSPVINHYAPTMLKQHTVVGAAVITTYTVLGPRLAKDAERQKRKEKAETDTERTDRGDDEPDQTDPDAAESMGGYASI